MLSLGKRPNDRVASCSADVPVFMAVMAIVRFHSLGRGSESIVWPFESLLIVTPCFKIAPLDALDGWVAVNCKWIFAFPSSQLFLHQLDSIATQAVRKGL